MAAGVIQADGTAKVEPRMNVKHVADAVVHGQPAAGRQRAVHDGDGHQHALRRRG